MNNARFYYSSRACNALGRAGGGGGGGEIAGPLGDSKNKPSP